MTIRCQSYLLFLICCVVFDKSDLRMSKSLLSVVVTYLRVKKWALDYISYSKFSQEDPI